MKGIRKAEVNEAGLGGQRVCGVPHSSIRGGGTQDSQMPVVKNEQQKSEGPQKFAKFYYGRATRVLVPYDINTLQWILSKE